MAGLDLFRQGQYAQALDAFTESLELPGIHHTT